MDARAATFPLAPGWSGETDLAEAASTRFDIARARVLNQLQLESS